MEMTIFYKNNDEKLMEETIRKLQADVETMRKQIIDMKGKITNLEKFIFLEQEPLKKLYETYKKITGES